jgi:hypothetical protein
MATFEIEILERQRSIVVPGEDGKPSPEIRILHTSIEADTNDQANERALEAWEQQYGTPPDGEFTIRITHRPKARQ